MVVSRLLRAPRAEVGDTAEASTFAGDAGRVTGGLVHPLPLSRRAAWLLARVSQREHVDVTGHALRTSGIGPVITQS